MPLFIGGSGGSSNSFAKRVLAAAWKDRKNIARGVKRAYNHAKGHHSAENAKRRKVSHGKRTSKAFGKVHNVQTSVSDRNVKVVKAKRKVRVKGGVKKVKVSPLLRKKIMQVADGSHIHGYYQDNRLDLLDPGLLPGQQNVERLPNRTLSYGGYLFNYDRILHAASRLWNGKAANTQPIYTDANNFSPLDTVINVKKQWWTFRLRNNSTRTVQIRLYKCVSKNAVQAQDAQFLWSSALGEMGSTGELISGTTINTMHVGPSLANQFRVGYKVEEMKITMDPGQAYTFGITGPSMVYDGKKFYDGTVYKSIQKQDMQLLWVSNVDLVGTSLLGVAGAFGYAGDASAPTPGQERVLVESTYHCSMSMPEKVGGVTTAVGSLFQNNNRVKRVAIDDFQPTTGFTAVGLYRRDEENPEAVQA